MAQRFAVKTGNWSDTTVWDSGALPVAGDTVYPNGFTVTLDQDINVASLNNNISPVAIPNIATPAMTSNTQPSGTVISSNNSGTAYNAFSQDGSTNIWQSAAVSVGWLGYTFPTSKVIKRYIFKIFSTNNIPKTWTFEGSNDGFATAGVVLDTVASYTTVANYTSVLLANTTSYTSYRINVTATQGNAAVQIAELEMTESQNASPVYGAITGGTFTVPSSLSGTRNIVQSGGGIVSNNSGIFNTNHTSGNTVNFNVASGGYIFNTNMLSAGVNTHIFNITGNGAINFNGDLYFSNTIGSYLNSFGHINITSAANVTINGNIYLPQGAASSVYNAILLNTGSSSAILNINGTVYGSTYGPNIYINNSSGAVINVTGNLISNTSPCINSLVYSNINITGNINMNNSGSNSTVIGNCLLTMNGSITNKGSRMAVYVTYFRFLSTATPYWIFQTNGASDMTLAYGAATGAYPNEADVRFGTTYAASPTRTGTLRVPLPQYVSQGVLTDNTTGTAYLSATDVWNVLTSTITTPGSVGKLVSDNLNATISSRATQTSVDTANTNINNLPANTTNEVWNKATTGITTAGSIGERLKNASTVQTNGDQLAAYIV